MVSKEWAVVLTNVTNVSSLAALLPVLGEIRLGSHRARVPTVGESGKKAIGDEEPPPVAVGVRSVLLFICAELCHSWKLFDPSAKHIETAVNKVKEVMGRPQVPNSSISGKLIPILNECFADENVRTTIHSLALLTLLTAVLVSLLLRSAKKATVSGVLQMIVKIVVLVGFGWSQRDLTLKVWNEAVSGGLVAALYFPLQAMGVLLSSPVSAGFGCSHLIFWVARFSMVFQSNVPQLRNLLQKPMSLTESPEMGVMLINILIMGWLLVGHLPQVESAFVVLGLLVAMSFMPPLLTACWEPLLKAVGWNLKSLAAATQVLHLSVIGMLLLVGGTINVLCITGMFNLLLRIHGQDAFGLQLG